MIKKGHRNEPADILTLGDDFPVSEKTLAIIRAERWSANIDDFKFEVQGAPWVFFSVAQEHHDKAYGFATFHSVRDPRREIIISIDQRKFTPGGIMVVLTETEIR